jgi:hypothetical protein
MLMLVETDRMRDVVILSFHLTGSNSSPRHLATLAGHPFVPARGLASYTQRSHIMCILFWGYKGLLRVLALV